jgi:hypothetical protein
VLPVRGREAAGRERPPDDAFRCPEVQVLSDVPAWIWLATVAGLLVVVAVDLVLVHDAATLAVTTVASVARSGPTPA